MGGANGSVIKQQNAIAQQQEQTAQQYANMSQQSLNQMNTLTQPVANYYQHLVGSANSGNYNALVSAAGPQLGVVSQQMDAAKQNIMSTVPAGAGQQAALAQLPIQSATATAGALNQGYTGALGGLQQIGAAYGGVGLQEAGATQSALSGAASTTAQIGNEQAQGKADSMGFLGSLAGGAGSALSGSFHF